MFQRLVVQAATLQDARPIVLNDHIHVRNQRPDQFDRLGLFEIETDALLAAILLDEVDTAAVLEKGDGARRVALLGLFDLNDLGSEFGHQAGGRRAGQILGEIQDGDAVQHGRLLACRGHTLSLQQSSCGV